jgi:lysozyme
MAYDAQPKPRKRDTAFVLAVCTAAAGACVQLTASSEGFLSKAKPDPAGIPTGCYGERVDQSDLDPNRVYSASECAARLRNRLAREYAPKILACLPQVADDRRVAVFGALLDAAYNAGPGAVCGSRMARSIKAGDWKGACNGFYGWRSIAHDRKGRVLHLKGLETRRANEAKLCMRGAS